ncbi:RNA polymerase sigma factor [Butyricimonas faecalis]|nr:sigma-70 family RNA polymerase sigma factor [Butyricimonas faecalis]
MKPEQENLTDEELLKRYCDSGELVYFVEAYKRYMPLVYGVALKYLKRPEDAQDAVMQLFEELVVKIKEVEIQSFKAWLYTCIRNNCLMEIRKRSKNLSVSLDDSFMEFCDDFHLTVVSESENREESLRECVESLPEKQRISVKYFFFDELSYKEVEERTGFSLKMVKSFIQNGKRNLKLCLERKGVTSNGMD